MPQWYAKDPGRFTVHYHNALDYPEGKHLLIATRTLKQAKAAQERWRLFIYCLKHYPLHSSARKLGLFNRRTSIEYNDKLDAYEVMITVTKTNKDLFAGVEV